MAVITYREALRQALIEEMQRDESVFIIGEEVGQYEGTFRVTEKLLEMFGERRVIDTPISEEGFTGAAVGAAMVGLRPVVEYMTTNFAIVAMDPIINHASKMYSMSGGQYRCPLVLRGPGGPGVQLSSQHSQSLESWFVHSPGIKVVMPATPADAKGLLKTAIRDDNPVFFIEHGLLYNLKGEVPEGEHLIPFGKADIKRQGRDVSIITYSRAVHTSLKAADQLAQQGIECEVVDLRTLSPMDTEAIVASVRRTHRAIVVAEDWKTCGMSAEIAARIYEEAFDDLDAPVVRVAGADVPMPYARNLEKLAIPSPADVVEAVRQSTWRQIPGDVAPDGRNGHLMGVERGAAPEPALAD